MRFSCFCRSSFARQIRRSPLCLLLAAILSTSAFAQKETILHDFVIAPFGIHPTSQLVADSAGNLYGTTSTGGTHNAGVVFELVRGSNGIWSQKILYIFGGSPDGSTPMGRLV
jgi:uncharacterized repeat protein (TIGR03803 family)